jgi:hypothetical protein
VFLTRLAFTAARNSQPKTQPLVTTLSPNASDVAVSSFASFGGRIMPKDPSNGGIASLNAIVGSGLAAAAAPGAGTGLDGDDSIEEDLFALPMSPRSPEMKRSPFSLL